jgi:glycosyltransferase involved in cell wall biosynthesis
VNNKQDSYILWLPSWYPNKLEPYNGDFIQRHAKAAALYSPITVIFFTQYGASVKSELKIEENFIGNLKEFIVYIPFNPIHVNFIDKIRYNLIFYFFSKKILKQYFKEKGLPSLVHVHVPVKAGNLALWIKRKFKVSFIVSEQASTYLKEAPDNYYKRHWFYKWQVRKIFSEAIKITNVSATIGTILKQLFSIKDLQVIYNTVDSSRFNYSGCHKNETFTYIHVSTLNDQKNIFGILRSFKKMVIHRKDWKLIIVGPFTKDIVQFITEYGLENQVELVGEVPYVKVAMYMKEAHVFVLFSKHENFPCVIVEALCCGLPVVTSDVAGIPEGINESNGILVPSEDEDGLVKGLIKIREDYDHYKPGLISKEATEKYRYETIGKRFRDLYKDIQNKN